MSYSFIQRADQGNRSVLSFLGTIFLCIGGLVLGQTVPLGIAVFLVSAKNGDSIEKFNTTAKLLGYLPYPLSFTLLMMGFITLIIFLWGCLRLFHQRKLSSLWSYQSKFRWKDFMLGFGVTLLLIIATDIYGHLTQPETYQWVFSAKKFFFFLPFALVLITLQTLSEELFFRGYLYQAFGLLFRNKWFSLVITSLIFGLFHFGNTEMELGWRVGIVYIGSGLMLGLCVVFSKGIEFGYGYHLLNNLYLSTILTFPGSSLSGPTLYLVPKPTANQVLEEFAVQFSVFLIALMIIYRKNLPNLLKGKE